MRNRLVRPTSALLLVAGGILLIAAAGFFACYSGLDTGMRAVGGVVASGGFALALAWWTQKQSLQSMLGTGQEFPGIDLNGRDLSVFYLPGKNFSGASFIKANLRGAKLHGANLMHTWLNDTDLRGTRFDEIHLYPSNTLRASSNLKIGPIQPEADMNGAHLSGAKYDDATRWPSHIDPEAAGAIKVKRPWWRRVFGG